MRGVLDLSDARRELQTFAQEAGRVRVTPRAGSVAGSSPARGSRSGSAEGLSPGRINRAEDRQAAAVERLAIATERRAARMEREETSAVTGGRGATEGGGGGGGGGGFGLPARLFSAYALYRTAQAVARFQTNNYTADRAIGAADNRIEALQAQKQKIDANSIGVLDTVYGLFMPSGTSQGRQAVVDQSIRVEQTRMAGLESGWKIGANRLARAGFDSGGLTGERRASISAKAASETSRLDEQTSQLLAQFSAGTKGKYDPVEQNRRLDEISRVGEEKKDIAEQAKQDLYRHDILQQITAQSMSFRGANARDIAGGVNPRQAARDSLLREQLIEHRHATLENFALVPAMNDTHTIERAAQARQFFREDAGSNMMNRAGAAAARMRANRNELGAGLATSYARMGVSLANAPPEQRGEIASRSMAEMAEMVTKTVRGFAIVNASNSAGTEVTRLLLARNARGSALRGSELAQEQELAQMGTLERTMTGMGIRARGNAERSLINQQFDDAKNLQLIGLRGGLQSSAFRAGGQQLAGQGNDIFTSATQRAQALKNQGPEFDEARNLTLGIGINDLQAFRRQVQYGGSAMSVDAGSLPSGPQKETRVEEDDIPKLLKTIADNQQALLNAMTQD